MSRHVPRICPEDGTPPTADGRCTKCGRTIADGPRKTDDAARTAPEPPAPLSESSGVSALDASFLAPSDPGKTATTGWPAMVGGDFTIEVLNEVPSSASRIPLPVTSTSDVLAQVGRAGGAVAKVAGAETVYRIVPSNEMAKGIAGNPQRYANSTKGDASVLIKDAATGRIRGHAALEKTGPGSAAMLGPVAWQAMAIVTQQHFLNEINGRLAKIETGISNLEDLIRSMPEGELDAIIDELNALEKAYERGLLNDDERRLIRDRLHETNVIRRQIMRRFKSFLESQEEWVDPRDVVSDLETLVVAFHVQGRLAALRLLAEPPTRTTLAIDTEQGRRCRSCGRSWSGFSPATTNSSHRSRSTSQIGRNARSSRAGSTTRSAGRSSCE